MSFSVRSNNFSPLELQYAQLKRQSDIDQSNSQTQNGSKERNARRISDDVTLSSALLEADESIKSKPSQPVTIDEMQALRNRLSIYV
jgi:hypothetical protein